MIIATMEKVVSLPQDKVIEINGRQVAFRVSNTTLTPKFVEVHE
jgi:hypothetical protein